MKKTLVILLFLFIALVSCFAADLTVWVSWEGEDFYRAVAEEFETNTGKTVEIVYVPKLDKKLFPALKSGNLPDVCMLKDVYTAAISVSDLVVTLSNELLRKIGNFEQRHLQAFIKKDSLLAVPYYADTQLAIVNLDFFDEANIATPSKKYTFEELESMKDKIVADKKIIAWDFMSPYIFYSFARHYSELVDENGKPDFDTPQMKEVIKTVKSYFDNGIAVRYERGALISKFEIGETGIILQGSYLIKGFLENGMNLAIMGFPKINNESVSPVIDSKGFAFFNREKLELSVEFISFLYSRSLDFCEEYFKLPLWTNKFPASLMDLSTIVEAGEYMIGDDRFQNIYNSVMKPVLQSVYTGANIDEVLIDSQNYVEENW